MLLSFVLRVLTAIFIGAGLLLLLGGLMTHKETQAFVDQAVRTEGVVVELTEIMTDPRHPDAEPRYLGVVEFGLPNGTAQRFTTLRHTRVNEAVMLLYSPSDPRRVEIDEYWAIWGERNWSLLLSLPFLAAGAGMWRVLPRRPREDTEEDFDID